MEKLTIFLRKHKKLSALAIAAVLGCCIFGVYEYRECAQDKQTVAGYLKGDDLIMIIEHYDIENYKTEPLMVYGADEPYFREAFSAMRVKSDDFYRLSEQEKEQIIDYLANLQYRWKWDSKRTHSGMSPSADTYWFYITPFQENGEDGGSIYFTLSEDMRVSHVDASKVSRYVGAEAEFLNYLDELLADKEKMRDEYEK